MTTFLTQNFTLDQFIKSDTATRLNINNTPPPQVVENLRNLCANVLDPIYANYRNLGPIIIHSGYRCLALNRAVGSSDGSDHVVGCAADIEINGVPNLELAKWVATNIKTFNQVILEFYDPAEGPNSGWVHVALHPAGFGVNKMERLIINRHGKSTF